MKIDKKKFYYQNGYINIDYILDLGVTYTAIVSARGVGKTYGILKYMIEREQKFLHVRRTQTQVDLINTENKNNYLKLNQDLGWNIHPIKAGKRAGYYTCIKDDKDNWIPDGPELGETAALSTMYNLRGVADDDSIKFIFYDEFIPLKSEKPIKEEFDAFANMIETYGRNRELEGKPPLRVVMAANSNNLNNAIFTGFGIVNKLLKAKNAGKEFIYFPARDLLIIFASNAPVSKAKKQTALYRLMNGTDFEAIALDNEFTGDDLRFIQPQPLSEYRPIAVLGPLCIYKHKADKKYYVTPHISGTPPEYPETDAKIFFKRHYRIYDAYEDYNILYSDYLTKTIFSGYIK